LDEALRTCCVDNHMQYFVELAAEVQLCKFCCKN